MEDCYHMAMHLERKQPSRKARNVHCNKKFQNVLTVEIKTDTSKNIVYAKQNQMWFMNHELATCFLDIYNCHGFVSSFSSTTFEKEFIACSNI